MRFSLIIALLGVGSALALPMHENKGSIAAKAASIAKASKNGGGKNAGSNSTSVASSANSTSVDSSANSTSIASSANSTSVDDSSSANSTDVSANATSTSTASASTKTRPCDLGDQSLAAGLGALTTVGIGSQAAVATLQATNNTDDFNDAVTRLQQFVTTAGTQLTMALGIADDGSFAQTQLGLLQASQKSQEAAVANITGDAASNADALTALLQTFVDSTNNAQDGQTQALIDCFIPPNAVSG